MQHFLYGLFFFLITLLIRYLLFVRERKTGKKSRIWTGYSTVTGICIVGLIEKNPAFFLAIIGFMLGEFTAKEIGWM